MNWLKMLLWIIIGAVGLLISMIAYLYFNQERIMFLPKADFEIVPKDMGLTHKEMLLRVEADVDLHGWYFPAENSGTTILFCHGNAGNISNRLETAEYLVSLGVNVLMFDYRGYGKSTGQPTEIGLYADAQAALDWLVKQQRIPLNDIVLFGRSLGGAVAVELAVNNKCKGLIIESGFTSMSDMAQTVYPWLPMKYLVRHKLASIDKIGNVKIPVLVMHSKTDEIIPYAMGEALYEKITAPKKFMELTGDHNNLAYYSSEIYRVNLYWIFNRSE